MSAAFSNLDTFRFTKKFIFVPLFANPDKYEKHDFNNVATYCYSISYVE